MGRFFRSSAGGLAARTPRRHTSGCTWSYHVRSDGQGPLYPSPQPSPFNPTRAELGGHEPLQRNPLNGGFFSPQPLQLRHLPPVKVRDTWHRHEASTSDGVVGAPLIRQEEVFAMCYSGFYLFILSGSEGRWRRFKVKPGRGFQKEKSEEV